MEQINALRDFLLHFPQWGQQALTVDGGQPLPERSSLFPLGQRVLEQREDVLGNRRLRLRQSFLLRRYASPGENAAAWLLWLQQWLVGQPVQPLETAFGRRLRLQAEDGKRTAASQTGTGIYELKIHVEYEKE